MKGPKKTSSGEWLVDERPYGSTGRRFRKKFDTKAEANRYFKWLQAESQGNKQWEPDLVDDRKLSTLVDDWYNLHGHTLKTGKTKHSYIKANVKLLGDPLARQFTSEDFVNFRRRRLEEKLTTVGRELEIKPATVNYDLVTLKAVYNKLIELGNWKGANPVEKVKPLKLDDQEMGFLDLKQIGTLIDELNKSNSECVAMVAKICLSTGARWGESQGLRGEQIRNGRITFYKTKTTKMRTVPITKKLENEIFSSRPRTGPLFNYCYKSFLRALKKTKIQLPDNQATHVLRHTFASQFVMAGGNLVTLSKILGHATIQMTMRYAHLAPEYLEDATRLNPLTLYQQEKGKDRKAAG